MKWFRMYIEAVDDEKLRLLAFEDRWHFVALLCCKGAGILDRKDHLTRRKVALKLGLSEREIDEVARRLAEVGLIDQETLEPLAWAHRQYESDTSTERVREYRKRMKRFGNVSGTAQETETETESETETEKKKTRPRVARPDSVSEQAWNDWLAVRKAKRAGPVTPTALARLENEARRAGYSLQAAVEEAAARGWQSFKAEWVAGQQSDNAMAGAL